MPPLILVPVLLLLQLPLLVSGSNNSTHCVVSGPVECWFDHKTSVAVPIFVLILLFAGALALFTIRRFCGSFVMLMRTSRDQKREGSSLLFFDPRHADKMLGPAEQRAAKDWVKRQQEKEDDAEDGASGRAVQMREQQKEQRRKSKIPADGGDKRGSSGGSKSKSPERSGSSRAGAGSNNSKSPDLGKEGKRQERRTTGPARGVASAKSSSSFPSSSAEAEDDRLNLEAHGWHIGTVAETGAKYYYNADNEVQWSHPLTGATEKPRPPPPPPLP